MFVIMEKKRSLILVTNDDGIAAPGIAAVVEVMKTLGEVIVVAPDQGQSGMGHAISISSILRVNKKEIYGLEEAYACSGTPVDCVKMALSKLMGRRPDLVVSGINHGANMSINVIYSGTMGAAIEGAVEGIPSIGFSLCDFAQDADFSAAKKIAHKVAERVLTNGMPKDVCFNVNIPKLPFDELKGIKVCRQARANWVEEIEEKKDPSGKPYYWLTGQFDNHDKAKEDTDVWALDNGYVSLVPTQFDLTAHKILEEINDWGL